MNAEFSQPIYENFRDKFLKEIYGITTSHDLELVKAEKSSSGNRLRLYLQRINSWETVLTLELDFSEMDKVIIDFHPDSVFSEDFDIKTVKCLDAHSIKTFLVNFDVLIKKVSYRSTLADLPIGMGS
ncbi:MAG: hypothetical protein HWQ37_16055 [Nostoc sp. NMS4]|nr:hypothetical protein [Nostoc sp. NMS4]